MASTKYEMVTKFLVAQRVLDDCRPIFKKCQELEDIVKINYAHCLDIPKVWGENPHWLNSHWTLMHVQQELQRFAQLIDKVPDGS